MRPRSQEPLSVTAREMAAVGLDIAARRCRRNAFVVEVSARPPRNSSIAEARARRLAIVERGDRRRLDGDAASAPRRSASASASRQRGQRRAAQRARKPSEAADAAAAQPGGDHATRLPPRRRTRRLGGGVFLEQLGELLGHGAAELLGIDDGDGAAVVARHVVADADGDQLDRRARLDLLDDPAQMAFEIVAGIDRERRIVDRRAVGDHHQDLALLGARQQPLMRPVERLAVDVLLEQALAHHQAEILARAPPRRVGRLVDDVAQIVEAAGIGRLAGGEPLLARLPALPGARGEAEDLDLDAAALERARQNIGAGGGDRDRAAAHGAGIVEQQRHHGVAEFGVLLGLERERMHADR